MDFLTRVMQSARSSVPNHTFSISHFVPKPLNSWVRELGTSNAKELFRILINPYPQLLMNTPNEPCIKVCNSLLRGELSAIETYGQAIRKHSDSPAAERLRDIRSEHITAAKLLADNVREMGGEPETDSGGWGVFAKTVQGAANLFGPGSAIESLQKGEEAGRGDYESALANDEVMAECKAMISDKLLPAVRSHISQLEGLEKIA